MKPISLVNQLPLSSVMDLSEEEVWWFDESSFLFDESSIVSKGRPAGKYTHWLPIDAIPLSLEDEDCV